MQGRQINARCRLHLMLIYFFSRSSYLLNQCKQGVITWKSPPLVHAGCSETSVDHQHSFTESEAIPPQWTRSPLMWRWEADWTKRPSAPPSGTRTHCGIPSQAHFTLLSTLRSKCPDFFMSVSSRGSSGSIGECVGVGEGRHMRNMLWALQRCVDLQLTRYFIERGGGFCVYRLVLLIYQGEICIGLIEWETHQDNFYCIEFKMAAELQPLVVFLIWFCGELSVELPSPWTVHWHESQRFGFYLTNLCCLFAVNAGSKVFSNSANWLEIRQCLFNQSTVLEIRSLSLE